MVRLGSLTKCTVREKSQNHEIQIYRSLVWYKGEEIMYCKKKDLSTFVQYDPCIV